MAFVLLLMIIDNISGLAGSRCRFSRVLRPLVIVCRFDNVRRVLRNILRCIPKVSTVAVLLCAHLIIFAFIGNTFLRHFNDDEWGKVHCEVLPYNFSATPAAGCPRGSQVREDYFGSFSESLVQLFICLTTANFPDIMMPYIRTTAERSRFNAFFFVLFLMIGLYFLLNLQ